MKAHSRFIIKATMPARPGHLSAPPSFTIRHRYSWTATIRAVEDTDLLSIGKDDFERLVANDRQLADAVKRISHQRAISNLSAGGTESAAAIATLLKRSHHAVRKRAHLLEIKLARSLPGPKPKWK
jgi:CRP-like cAMP-binding protein